jgi:adenylate kinase
VEFHGCIAITGSPGVGKTTLAHLLSEALEFEIQSIESIAAQSNCLSGKDETDNTTLIDTNCLQQQTQFLGKDCIVEGHLSHFIPSNIIILLRCHPIVLKQRLEKRAYIESKIIENVEWEFLGGAWTEISQLERQTPVLEFDTSNEDEESICQKVIQKLLNTSFSSFSIQEHIDWIEEAEIDVKMFDASQL